MSITVRSADIENNAYIPDLVSSPPDSDDDDVLPTSTKLKVITGRFPWILGAVCDQSEFQIQATRWMKLSPQDRNDAYGATKRLLVMPFLFQELVIPEKWLRWAHMKGMMTFGFQSRDKILPSGKLSRQHYLVVKMLERSISKLQTITDRKKTVSKIMSTMYSIRNTRCDDVDKAINELKANESVKFLMEFLRSEMRKYPLTDRTFFDGMDRQVLIALFCLRQFAETVHIITCEGRNLASEVQNQFTDQNYYLQDAHNIGREKGNNFYKNQQYQDAIDAYTEAINKMPFHYLLYSNRCQALIKLNDYESAFSDAYRTIVLQPDFGKGYYKVVLCLSELGHFDEALDWGKQSLAKCDEVTEKSLKDLIESISKRADDKRKKDGVDPKTDVQQAETGAARKKAKAKRKKKKYAKDEKEEIPECPELVSDDEFEECQVIFQKLKKDEEEEKIREEERRKLEKERKKREERDKRERVVVHEYEQIVQKAASEYQNDHYVDACKTYSLAIEFVEKHEMRTYSKNELAVLLYTRGISSQRQGSPTEIDTSKRFFQQIITEHRTFSHLCMAYYANAKSTFLLNDFEQAKKEVSAALQLVKRFPVRGVLTLPGSTDNIPESDESFLRREIQVLLQQCKVPPIPTAVCQYEECSQDYSRKEIHLSDLNFEGYFEVVCEWHCILNYHLRCWAKFKHEFLNLSGDKDVLGMQCRTPDCRGKVTLIRMLDDRVLEKKKVESSPEHKIKEVKQKASKYMGRMSKSESNLKKYNEKQLKKSKRKQEWKRGGDRESPSAQITRKRDPNSENIPADKDLSDATIYVKDSQKNHGKKFSRGNRRVAPASLQHFCASLKGYRKEMSMKTVNELIERAKVSGFSFSLPDDLREEIEQFSLSFGNEEEPVQFTNIEKIKMPFIFKYFVNFFTDKGPLNTNSLQFTNEHTILPDVMKKIVTKCGGLVSFLNSSPLFIQVPPFIGIHSQHQHMKKLTEKQSNSNTSNTPPQDSPVDLSPYLEFEDFGLSQFAKEFYQVGAHVEISDLINLTGGFPDGTIPSYGQGEMYKLEQFPEPKRQKSSQNSETSSMYSLEDFTEARSEYSSQASYETEKSASAQPGSPIKRQSTHPPQLKEIPTNAAQLQLKKIIPKKKMSTVETQTEGHDDTEKHKEAISRLQERVLELEGDYTKLKKTSQAREEALAKDLEQSVEREKVARREKESIKQSAESEIAKVVQFKKQMQAAEAKAEQCRAREEELERNLLSLTEGMQHDRELHLAEIVKLRKTVEEKEKDSTNYKSRAIRAEIDLTRTKEAYHVGAHMQAKNYCEQGVREFDIELRRLETVLPEHILHHFKLARKTWADSVIACGTTIETLKAAYASIIDQISAGRPLPELPSVPDLKPPPPGPNPRHMMIQMQRSGMVNLGSLPNGGADGNGVKGVKQENGNQSPLPAVTKKRVQTPPTSAPPQPPIGSELPKAPRKKNFVQLVDKLSKNLPQLSREQLEVCAQQVRTENKGLTGLLYEEIEQRIRSMTGLDNMLPAQAQAMPTVAPLPTMLPHLWKAGASAFHVAAREVGDFWDLEDEAVCPICCDPLRDGKISTLECQHKFHFDCINKWMQKQRTCPNCRKFMVDTSEFPSIASQPPNGVMRNHN